MLGLSYRHTMHAAKYAQYVPSAVNYFAKSFFSKTVEVVFRVDGKDLVSIPIPEGTIPHTPVWTYATIKSVQNALEASAPEGVKFIAETVIGSGPNTEWDTEGNG